MAKKQIFVDDLLIPKYRPLLYDKTHTHIILTSGRAGTKSSGMSVIVNSKVISDDDCSAIVMRKHHNKLRKTVYKEFLRAIARMGLSKTKHYRALKSPMEIQYLKNRNTVYFTGSDSVDDTKGIIDEEKHIKVVVLDELTEFFDDGEGADEIANIEATFVRGNDEEFKMIYLFNPPKNPNSPIMQWLKMMEQRPDCIHIHTDYRDVPKSWLGQKLIDAAEMMKKLDPKMYNWVWLGLCVGIDELIYYMFGEGNKAKPTEFDRFGRESLKIYKEAVIGGDYGQQNATTFQIYGLDHYNKVLQGLTEYYHSGRESGKQRTPSKYAEDLIEECIWVNKMHKTRLFYLYLDPSARGLQEEIKRVYQKRARELDFQILVRDADNDVALGISRVSKLMTFKILKLNPLRQKHQIEELGLYEYDKKSIEKGKEVPVKENDHCCDATRYAVMGVWIKVKTWLPAGEQ